MVKFIIPRRIITNPKEDITGLYVLVYICCYLHQSLDGYVHISIKEIITWCGYTPDRHKGKINDLVKFCLHNMKAWDIIDVTDEDIESNYAFMINFKINIPKNNFAKLSLEEVDLIRGYCADKQKKYPVRVDSVIHTLAYIRVNMMYRTPNQQECPWVKPETYYRHLNSISDELKYSPKQLQRAIGVLKDLEIIKTATAPRYLDAEQNWHTDVTIFTDFNKTADEEIAWCKTNLKNLKKGKSNNAESA